MMIAHRAIVDILIEIITKAKEVEGGYTRFSLMVVCLMTIFFVSRKDIGKVCAPVIVSSVLLFEPHLYVYLYQETSYKRFFWILPEAIIVAYTIILLIANLRKKFIKAGLVIVLSASMIITGQNVYSVDTGFFRRAENIEQVDQSLIDLSNAILSIDPEPKCVMPFQAISMIRVANPNIIQVAGRNFFGYIGVIDPLIDHLVSSVSSENPDSSFVFSLACSRGITVVVTMSYTQLDENISSYYGYELVKSVGDYNIYYNPNPGIGIEEWYVTQYGPNWGGNYFYTIEDTEGNLIIIDGGHFGNSKYLDRLIIDHNNHVSAWIFTSLDDNHIGAAYDYLKRANNSLIIDSIIIQDYTDDMLGIIHDHEESWESPHIEISDDFVDIINQMDNVTYVNANDNIDILGLNIHVYHIWDDSVVQINSRETSNSSMVFSASGREDTILFLSDVTRPIENDIFESIGDDCFDYITANDHGNWSFDYQWYSDRNPIGLFIDQYSASVEEGGQAYGFYSYCLENGYNVYTFNTVPNRIIIR